MLFLAETEKIQQNLVLFLMRKGRDKKGNTAACSIISVPVVLSTDLELSARILILHGRHRNLLVITMIVSSRHIDLFPCNIVKIDALRRSLHFSKLM